MHSSFSGSFIYFLANFSISKNNILFCWACYSTTAVCSKTLSWTRSLFQNHTNFWKPPSSVQTFKLHSTLFGLTNDQRGCPNLPLWLFLRHHNHSQLQIPEHHASWSVYGRSVWNLWRDAWQTIGCQQCVHVLLPAASVWFPFPSVAF